MATPPRVFMLSGRGSELGIIRSQLRLRFRSTPISPNFLGQHRKITSLQYYFSCRSEQIRGCPSAVQAPKSGNWFWADYSCVHSWLGGVLCQGFGRWTRIQKWCFQISLLHGLDFVCFNWNSTRYVTREINLLYMSAFFRTVVCLQYFLLMTLSGNSKYSFLYFSPVPFQESQRPRPTRAVSPNQTISLCRCK